MMYLKTIMKKSVFFTTHDIIPAFSHIYLLSVTEDMALIGIQVPGKLFLAQSLKKPVTQKKRTY